MKTKTQIRIFTMCYGIGFLCILTAIGASISLGR